MVLQRAGHDFRSRGGAAVDQYDDRLTLDQVPGAGAEALGFFGVAAARRDDLAPLQERVRYRDRLIEQTARIVAQIDDEALQLVRRDLGLQIGDRLLQVLGGLLVDLGDADVADVVLRPRAHGPHADDVARDRYLDRLVLALAHDGELDLSGYRAAHLLDRLVQGETLHVLFVDLGDDVVGHDAG